MEPKTLSPEQQALVNEFAVHMEHFGIPPLAARIFGVMLLVEPAEKSTQEIIALTGGSKGAISLMLRMMEHIGLVEKCPVPGKRGHGWRLRHHFMVHMIDHKLRAVRGIQDFLQNRLEAVSRQSEFAGRNLQEMLQFYRFLHEEMTASFERWKQLCPHFQNAKDGKGVSP